MIGQKGVPALHGGVERHVEELSTRLVSLGHSVTVFTRPNYTDPFLRSHNGIDLRSRPAIASKHFDAISHSLVSTLDACLNDFDVVHYHAIGPCLVAPLARVRGRRVVATIHGQDWRRAKWGGIAKSILQLGERSALAVPHATICVSRTLAETYRQQGHANVRYVPNGVCIESGEVLDYLAGLGVEPGRYLLFVGRLVPEKGAHHLIDAWKQAGRPLPLVIAGDTSHSDEYVRQLKADGQGVVFTGYVHGAPLATLFRHAGLFVLPSELEGLPLVLLEALAHGAPVLASDIAPNVEVLGERGSYFRTGDVAQLAERIGALAKVLDGLKREAVAARDGLIAEYDWDRVATLTDEIYRSLVA